MLHICGVLINQTYRRLRTEFGKKAKYRTELERAEYLFDALLIVVWSRRLHLDDK